jgi:hypothetical protein
VEIYRFHEILGQPLLNGDVQRDWRALEEHFAVSLPEDYKEFVTAYGPGCVNDQLYLFHPRAAGGDEGLRLETLWEQASYAFSELRRSTPEMYPYPVHPEPGGLVPVARSTSGNHVFIAPPQRGEGDWFVILDMGQWIPVQMPFTEFMWAALREELGIPIIEGEPTFEPIGTVEP